MEAKELLFLRLFERLGQVMKESGPAEAVSVCASDAPALAAAVSKERNLRIGRTSSRLRNPKNQAPLWARVWVEQNRAEMHQVELPEGTLGVLAPIKLKEKCLLCHGPEDGIAPEVLAALRSRYPEDRATGYQAGQLRGWFWIEVR